MEDEQIKKVVYHQKREIIIRIVFLILVLVLFVFFNMLVKEKRTRNINKQAITVSKNADVLITNNGEINRVVSNNTFSNSDEIIQVSLNTINLSSEEDTTIKYNIKYDIIDNTINNKSNSNNLVLVRFAYSYNNMDWNYIDNIISTYNGSISPNSDKYYDITRIQDTLRVKTDYELSTNKGEVKIYWKSETKIVNIDDTKGNFSAKYRVEYNR